MEKKWKDLQVGDYIWYYDHCKLHKQKITHIEVISKTDEIDTLLYGKVSRKVEEIYIEAGKGTKMKIAQYEFNKDESWWKSMLRFSNYEAALNYISYLRTKHIQKAHKLQKRLDRELNIIDKYEI